MINIIGLGSGTLDHIPVGIYNLLLNNTSPLFLRTKQHPIVAQLTEAGIAWKSFDDIYTKHNNFDFIYEEITGKLIAAAKEHTNIIYAVPGHPLVAEQTVQILLKKIPTEVKIIGGISFLDNVFTALQLDPIAGFQLIDACSLAEQKLNILNHTVIAQVYDSFSASNVKLTLLEKYPPHHLVTVLSRAGLPDEHKQVVPLSELDHNWELNNLAVVYVPPSTVVEKEFWNLCNIFSVLRGENGCPWDKAQTHLSLLAKFQEELDEYKAAVHNNDVDNMIEELGDILLHVVLSAQIGTDKELFSITDVIATLAKKMVHRHPHVFSDAVATSKEEALQLFNEMKKQEKKNKENL